ncbi:MAG: hypothetical protein NTW21_43650 [Verrucomicrobia bacterium]|nr:hypothetical protein [Verrucomicrobiota bacterium]
MSTIIKANKLKAVSQTHDRTVTLTTEDGKSYKATSPQIDMIFKAVEKSGHAPPPMARKYCSAGENMLHS